MSTISLKFGNNKEYSFECIGDTFVDKCYKFFLYLFGKKLDLLVPDAQNKYKIYTISQSQYEKTLKKAVVDSLTFQSPPPKFIQHCVDSVVKQTKLKNGIVLSNYIEDFTSSEGFNRSVDELINSNVFNKECHFDVIDRLKKLGLNTHKAQQEFIFEFVQYCPQAGETVLNYLLTVASYEKQHQNRPSWGEPKDPGIFIPSLEQAKILFGIKDFIIKKDEEGTRSALSILLEKIAIKNPLLKEKIKSHLPILSNFAQNVYTHSVQNSWYDGDGPLRTDNTITYYEHHGLSGGYLDKTEFLN